MTQPISSFKNPSLIHFKQMQPLSRTLNAVQLC